MTFSNRVAVIVGGTSGIGRASAAAFAARGARVVLGGRDARRGEDTAAALRAAGGDARYFSVDVTDSASVAALFRAIDSDYGRLDIAFNNAGWEGPAAPAGAVEEADWLRMIDTKLNGVWRCMRGELPLLQRSGGGAIVNMAGSWGLVGFPNYAPYCAAAHGIMGLTRAAALEYARAGIRVNAVCPGAVDAPMLDRMTGGAQEVKAVFGEQLAIGRICTAEEVAQAVLWLASPAASYVNGIGLPLDGGG